MAAVYFNFPNQTKHLEFFPEIFSDVFGETLQNRWKEVFKVKTSV
jgi:hypothetical protein